MLELTAIKIARKHRFFSSIFFYIASFIVKLKPPNTKLYEGRIKLLFNNQDKYLFMGYKDI